MEVIIAGVPRDLKFWAEPHDAAEFFALEDGGVDVFVVFVEVNGIIIEGTHADFDEFLLHGWKK